MILALQWWFPRRVLPEVSDFLPNFPRLDHSLWSFRAVILPHGYALNEKLQITHSASLLVRDSTGTVLE